MGLCVKNGTQWGGNTQSPLGSKGIFVDSRGRPSGNVLHQLHAQVQWESMQLAVQNNMLAHQMDVKIAYLNAPRDWEMFMQQPAGFEQVDSNGETLVCKLKKSLYGLKQSGWNWNNMLHNFWIREKFPQWQNGRSVCVRKTFRQWQDNHLDHLGNNFSKRYRIVVKHEIIFK